MENTEVAPEKHLRHLDAVDYNTDGGLIIGSSSLTNRLWTGELLYWSSCSRDRELSERDARALLDSGVSDVKWINGATRRFVAACDSGSVELWELSEEKDCLSSVVKPVQHDSIVSSLSVSSSAAKFVSSGYDRTIVVWDTEEFLPLSVFRVHYDIVWSVAFHASDADIFASCSQDGRVLVWDLRQSKPASVMETQFLPSLPTCVAWQRGSEHRLAVGTETGHVVLQDCRVGVGTPDIVHVHTRPVNTVAFAPHRSDWLASSSQDCTSAVTSFCQPAGGGGGSGVVWRSKTQQDFVQCVCWNPVSYELASCSWDATVLCRAVSVDSNSDCDCVTADNSPSVVAMIDH